MTNKLLSGVSAAAFSAAAFCALGSGASAGAVATRCDSYGCARIVCHDDGNRCYRVDDYGHEYSDYDRYRDDDRYGHYQRTYDHYGDERRYYEHDQGWRYSCDRDADRCYVRREDDSDRGW